ncbi:hypothetical protein B296_00018149 [Ensete ventricosum]|uniref:Uncharacterized protein n=1 Tax=Ensete ventricosum TaxID=4639 RepID=A0A426Z1R0_ENSVE|nr:hypothetical protein B296_00018149 [Ensete ventricosum]
MVRRPTSTPSASIHSVLDPDTLSSDSTDSLRAQLRLHEESSLGGSPFIPEIQDRPIPQHFQLLMLEAYDGGSDLMEHVAAAQCDSEITFKSENEYSDHDDGLVILARITNAYVKHIMIDIRSSVI